MVGRRSERGGTTAGVRERGLRLDSCLRALSSPWLSEEGCSVTRVTRGWQWLSVCLGRSRGLEQRTAADTTWVRKAGGRPGRRDSGRDSQGGYGPMEHFTRELPSPTLLHPLRGP